MILIRVICCYINKNLYPQNQIPSLCFNIYSQHLLRYSPNGFISSSYKENLHPTPNEFHKLIEYIFTDTFLNFSIFHEIPSLLKGYIFYLIHFYIFLNVHKHIQLYQLQILHHTMHQIIHPLIQVLYFHYYLSIVIKLHKCNILCILLLMFWVDHHEIHDNENDMDKIEIFF